MARSRPRTSRAAALLRQPLFRLLALSLASGVAVAGLTVAGLLALDAHRLRTLVLADRSPGLAIGLLLFGFVVTMGSWAMGTAVMRLGSHPADPEGGTGAAARSGAQPAAAEMVPQRVSAAP